eukprot:scaffold92273_cov41-Tisochrysis_lutea.AAC.2
MVQQRWGPLERALRRREGSESKKSRQGGQGRWKIVSSAGAFRAATTEARSIHAKCITAWPAHRRSTNGAPPGGRGSKVNRPTLARAHKLGHIVLPHDRVDDLHFANRAMLLRPKLRHTTTGCSFNAGL